MERLTTKISKDKVLKQLVFTKGHIRQACENANIGRTQFYHWLNTDNDFREKFINVYEGIKEYNQAQQLRTVYYPKDKINYGGKNSKTEELSPEMMEDIAADIELDEQSRKQKRRK
jgi:hypothetical protein